MAKEKRPSPQSSKKKGQTGCPYSIRRDGRDVIMSSNCMECGNGDGMKDHVCITSLICSLKKEYLVDSVILEDHIETQISGPTLELLKRCGEIEDEIKVLGNRTPIPSRDCSKCSISPSIVFSMLADSFPLNIQEIYEKIGALTETSMTLSKKAGPCSDCAKEMSEDLLYIFNRIEEVRAFILQEAFGKNENEGGVA